jgi:hypothetical protein
MKQASIRVFLSHDKELGSLGMLGVVTSLFGPFSPTVLQRRKARVPTPQTPRRRLSRSSAHCIPTYHTHVTSLEAMVL